MKIVRELKDAGNTVVIVEHDRNVIENTDYIIEICPGAGVHGGQITAVGNSGEIAGNKKSLIGKYLFNRK